MTVDELTRVVRTLEREVSTLRSAQQQKWVQNRQKRDKIEERLNRLEKLIETKKAKK